MPQFRKAISPFSLDAAARMEKTLALAFPEFMDSADKSSDSSEEERHSNQVLNLSNDSTYYADDEYLTSIIEGSSASAVSSLVVFPPNDGSDGESVYTTSSSGTKKSPMMDDDPLVSLSQTYCGISNGDEAVTVPHSSERPTPQDSFVFMLWEKILLAVVVLVVLFCCGITSIVIFEFRNPNPGTAAVPTTTSTNATIVPALPSSNQERFRLLCSYIGCDNNDPIIGTPQYEALFWMTNVDSPTILGDINKTDLANDDDLKRRIIQRYALLVFFFAVIGPEHLLLGGWASVTGARLPECLWPGVTCRATPGTKDPTVVVGLLFDATIARLHGSLPTDLGLLSNLESLVLKDTLLTGSLPEVLFSLSNLHTLRISNSTLSTILSTNIGKLSNLVFLEFSEGEFIDTIPAEIGLLTDLQFLNLAHNAFSGTVPTEVGHLQRLRKLSFQDNELTGTIPDIICRNAKRLEYLAADCFPSFFQQVHNCSPPHISCDCCTECF